MTLLLVGTGPDFEKIKNIVNESNYKERIILYGVTSESQALYNAMDIFVLPSKHEGFPVVLLEAQISGIPCVVPDRVTKEVDFGNIIWESIEKNPIVWAKQIENIHIMNENKRKDYYREHKDIIIKFDIMNNVKQLDNIYNVLVEKRQGL